MNTQIFEQIRQLKRQIMPNEKVVLFGSQARGDMHAESDWDLLLLLNKDKISLEDMNNYSYPFTKLGWSFGTLISPILYTESDWEKRNFTPLYKEIKQDGIAIT
jgi:predicted nucleotidyltransferase